MKTTASVAERVIAVLWSLSEAGTSLSLQEIARRCDLAPSTAHRLIKQLQAMGMVHQTPKRRYQPGGGLVSMGALAIGRSQIVDTLRPLVHDTMQRLEKPCILSLYMPTRFARVVVMHKPAASAHLIRSEHYPRRDLVWGATGRAILAFLDAADIDDAIDRAPPSPVTGRKADRDIILRELATIRGQGYGASQREVVPRGEAVAVPLFDGTRRVVGSLAVTEDDSRWNFTTRKYLAATLARQSARLPSLLNSLS
jgi:DNA-binding IclR family transcriptional regulator